MKMQVPHVRAVAAALHVCRYAQADLLRDPANPLRCRRLDDAAYTLRVLMDQRNATDAAAQAERLFAASSARPANQAGRAQAVIPRPRSGTSSGTPVEGALRSGA